MSSHVCLGDVTVNVNGALECSTAWIIQSYALESQPVDPGQLASAIGAGFFILVPFWAALYAGKQILKLFN